MLRLSSEARRIMGPGTRVHQITGVQFAQFMKLSDLCIVALRDARRLDRKKYQPYWFAWHEGRLKTSERCTVCYAGAVIAGWTCPDSTVQACQFSNDISIRLNILETCRAGHWLAAAERLLPSDEKLTRDQKIACRSIDKAWSRNFSSWDEFYVFLLEIERTVPVLQHAGL